MSKNKQPFVTGSRAYGSPKKDSDLDLVIIIENEQILSLLKEISDTPDKSLRFGKLNIIACNERAYDQWKEGTELLKKISPVTREQAIRVFEKLGVSSMYDGTKTTGQLSPERIEPIIEIPKISKKAEIIITNNKKDYPNKIKRFEKIFEESNLNEKIK